MIYQQFKERTNCCNFSELPESSGKTWNLAPEDPSLQVLQKLQRRNHPCGMSEKTYVNAYSSKYVIRIW